MVNLGALFLGIMSALFEEKQPDDGRARYEDRMDPNAEPPPGKVRQWVTDGQGRQFVVYRDYDPEDGKWT
jgi:hypothetical protein